ncbi:MAG: hypothetical protein U9N33_11895 [Campylobacterota bacterium]|nr:hypothetical protein [Campylobacterota bacterium]
MLGKFFELLYHKIFINIVVERNQTVVYVEVRDKNGMINNDSKHFQTTSLDNKIIAYINLFVTQSPYHYISMLDTSDIQGAIPSCSKKDIATFCDIESSKYMCYNKSWAYYSSKQNLNFLKQNYSKVGLDFIFSPFLILVNFFKDKISNPNTLYILVEDNNITISVFNESELLYGDHIDILANNEGDELLMDEVADEDLELDLDSSIDLDDIDAMDDIDGIDDFGDIEDLDTLDEIDEFAESETLEDENRSSQDNLGELNDDYKRFSLIQNSVDYFYKDARYKSEFVQSVFIADAIGVSGDLKRYLEEEMFVSVFVRQLDLAAELCEIAKMELA